MGDASWKAFERRIAKVFGGKRRGAVDHTGGSDIIVDGWSVECKLLSRPSYSLMLDACLQAERERPHPTDIPVAVVKRKGDLDKNALVIMRLETFESEYVKCVSSTASGTT